ncbi:MAG TPA: hypothetical protein VFJ83_14010 [Nocardioidaceae bacterium]|nr:hypothetical protein [Nocardioidaceae bacterium]
MRPPSLVDGGTRDIDAAVALWLAAACSHATGATLRVAGGR